MNDNTHSELNVSAQAGLSIHIEHDFRQGKLTVDINSPQTESAEPETPEDTRFIDIIEGNDCITAAPCDLTTNDVCCNIDLDPIPFK